MEAASLWSEISRLLLQYWQSSGKPEVLPCLYRSVFQKDPWPGTPSSGIHKPKEEIKPKIEPNASEKTKPVEKEEPKVEIETETEQEKTNETSETQAETTEPEIKKTRRPNRGTSKTRKPRTKKTKATKEEKVEE